MNAPGVVAPSPTTGATAGAEPSVRNGQQRLVHTLKASIEPVDGDAPLVALPFPPAARRRAGDGAGRVAHFGRRPELRAPSPLGQQPSRSERGARCPPRARHLDRFLATTGRRRVNPPEPIAGLECRPRAPASTIVDPPSTQSSNRPGPPGRAPSTTVQCVHVHVGDDGKVESEVAQLLDEPTKLGRPGAPIGRSARIGQCGPVDDCGFEPPGEGNGQARSGSDRSPCGAHRIEAYFCRTELERGQRPRRTGDSALAEARGRTSNGHRGLPPLWRHATTLEGRAMRAGRIITVIIGALLSVVGFAAAVGGGVLAVGHLALRDDAGYYNSPTERLQTSTAVLMTTVDISAEPGDWSLDEPLGTLRIAANAVDEDPIFRRRRPSQGRGSLAGRRGLRADHRRARVAVPRRHRAGCWSRAR